MVIKQLGVKFPVPEFKRLRYFSDDYLLEADLLIFDLNEMLGEIRDDIAENRYTLNTANYNYLCHKIEERVDQLSDFFEKKGNLFILTSSIGTVTLRISNGTGVYPEKELDILSTIGLNSNDFLIKSRRGDQISFDSYQTFFSSFDSSYEFVFQKFIGTPIATIVKSTQAVALQIPVRNGNIFMLPKLNLMPYLGEQYYNAFENFDKVLKERKDNGEEKITLPAWASTYSFGNELTDIHLLNDLQKEKSLIEGRIEAQISKLNYYDNLKRLFTATGKSLEHIVEYVLKEIGYNTQPLEENRDDIIISHDADVAVIEVKGVKGSAAEKNVAQLMKWVSTYHAKNEINPKGILIINTFKDKTLSDRTEESFPNQMLAYTKQMKLCLLTTQQLLEIYLDFKDNLISFEKVHKLLFSTIGILKYNSKNKILNNPLSTD